MKIRLIIFATAICLLGLNSFSQNPFEKINHLNHIQKNFDFDYLNEIWLKSVDINEDDAAGFAKRASEKMDKGYYKEAYADIEKAISIAPDYDYPYLLKGVYHLSFDSVQLAKEAINKAVELDSLNPLTVYYKGSISLYESNYDEAIHDFNKALEIDENFFLSYYGIGNVYLTQKKLSKAKKSYKKAVELNPTFYEAFYNLGLIEISENRKGSAIKYFKKAIASNEKFSPAYYMLGVLDLYSSKYNAAAENWDKAIEIDSVNVYYLFSRGGLNILRKKYENAYDDIIKVLKQGDFKAKLFADFGDEGFDEKVQNTFTQLALFDKNQSDLPDETKPLLKKYFCFSLIKEYIEAKNIIDKVYEKYSNNSTICFFMANNFEYQGNLDKAKECYLNALNYKPSIYEAYLKLGILYYRIGNYKESAKNLTYFMVNNDTTKVAYRFRAISYMSMGEFDKAISDFNEFMKMDSTDYHIIFNRATCYKSLNDYKNAILEYDKILKIRDKDSEAFYLRSECKYLNNDTIGALDDYNKISTDYLRYNHKVYFLGALIKTQLQLYDKAISDFSLGLAQDPNNSEMLSKRAMLYYNTGNFQNALIDFNLLLSLDPENAGIYYIRGLVYVKLRQFDKACSDFKTAESKGITVPESAMSVCNIGVK